MCELSANDLEYLVYFTGKTLSGYICRSINWIEKIGKKKEIERKSVCERENRSVQFIDVIDGKEKFKLHNSLSKIKWNEMKWSDPLNAETSVGILQKLAKNKLRRLTFWCYIEYRFIFRVCVRS